MRFYIINIVKNMEALGKICAVQISASNSSYIMYYNDDPDYLTVEEVDHDIFMNHHVIASNQINFN